ncbi:MAG: type II toxin-antitoxin system HicB family antitoxin [Acetobacteraceae bacterium]|nr:type II toxin-antitoxin system HicB family antitoxin [Acetobacteraceae bacterium]
MDRVSYRVILEPDEDGYRAIIPAFPRVFTCGDNIEDALRMAADAIDLELTVLHERGLPIPEPDGDAEIRVERVVVTPPAA